MTINPTTQQARTLAQNLLSSARFGALAVTLDGVPYVSRVAVVAQAGVPYTLVSTLSQHTKALLSQTDCAILLGEPGDTGDPLTHPRMTVMAQAHEADKTGMRPIWLAAIPKATVYYDFADFRLFRLAPTSVHLNGGFGKAFHLSPDDLIPTP